MTSPDYQGKHRTDDPTVDYVGRYERGAGVVDLASQPRRRKLSKRMIVLNLFNRGRLIESHTIPLASIKDNGGFIWDISPGDMLITSFKLYIR